MPRCVLILFTLLALGPELRAQVRDSTAWGEATVETPGTGDFAAAIDSLQHLNVWREVRHAIARGDTRLLAIDVARIPGLPDSSVATARDRLGFRTIPWTSDVVAGAAWERWQVLAAAFAARYNAYLWRTINQH